MRRALGVAILLALWFLGSQDAVGQCEYGVSVFLPLPCGGPWSSYPHGRGLNNLGGWVGYRDACFPAEADLPIYCPPGGAIQTLSLPPGATSGRAEAVSDSATIVGTSSGPPFQFETACIWWPAGSITVIPPPPGGDRSYAHAVNSSGTVVGERFTPAVSLPYRWANGVLTEIDPAPFAGGHAWDISDSGYITGYLGNLAVDSRAFRWKDGTRELLEPVLGHAASEGRAVNNAGTVVGVSRTYLGPELGYASTPTVWTPTSTFALPLAPGYGGGACIDINESGIILGELDAPLGGGASRYLEVLWIDGVAHALADLLSQPFNDTFDSRHINDQGQVLGQFGGGVILFNPDFPIGDLTHDCTVDGADLAQLLSHWGVAASVADLNSDGVVDGADLGILLGHWTTP